MGKDTLLLMAGEVKEEGGELGKRGRTERGQEQTHAS